MRLGLQITEDELMGEVRRDTMLRSISSFFPLFFFSHGQGSDCNSLAIQLDAEDVDTK